MENGDASAQNREKGIDNNKEREIVQNGGWKKPCSDHGKWRSKLWG